MVRQLSLCCYCSFRRAPYLLGEVMMSSLSRLWANISLFCHHMRQENAEADRQYRLIFGTTNTVAVGVLGATYFLGRVAIYFARRWQAAHMSQTIDMLCMYACVAIVWTLIAMRWLHYVRWPRWWAFPYVILVLCPGAWLLAQRARHGVDSAVLFMLQLPIVIVSAWYVHSRAKR